LNAVSGRVEINGFCDAGTFERTVANSRPDLVIMDIEGGECELLPEKVVPLLAGTDLIIELHPWVCRTIESDLEKRFSQTHQTEVILSRPRMGSDLPFGGFYNALFARWLVPKLDESRPEPMRWLILSSRKKQSEKE
jgi:hypothetical protein